MIVFSNLFIQHIPLRLWSMCLEAVLKVFLVRAHTLRYMLVPFRKKIKEQVVHARTELVVSNTFF